jgi:hypothetical protein
MTTEWEKPVADAIAAKLTAIDGIRQAISLGSDSLTMLPGALVLTPRLKLVARTGSHEEWRATYPCLVVVKVKSTDRILPTLTTLAGKIRIAWRTGIKLGLAYVQDSFVDDFDPELLELGGEDHPAYAFDIVATIRENITRTA